MEATSSGGRYLTLRDYLRVLRRYRIAIVVIAAIGAAAGLADAKRQTDVYQASATVSFQDPAQDLTLVGLGGGLIQNPTVLAAQNAATITRPAIMNVVRRELRRYPVSTLAAAVTGQVSSAGYLQVIGSSSSPSFAAKLADTVAEVVVHQSNQQAKGTFAAAAQGIERQIAATRHGPKSATSTQQLTVYANELAPLLSLSKVAQSAQVEQPAAVPTSPSSPHVLRSALLGLALGLLLAIALAFVRDTLDRRLRNPADIEESFSSPVVGHVRERVMGKVARPGRDGDKEAKLDLEAFRILRRNIEFLNLDAPPRSLVVTSAVPQEGKTTVAASLAFAAAAAGKRTLLVDGDLRRPSVAARLELEPSPGLTDYLASEATPQQILRVAEFVDLINLNGTMGGGSAGGSGGEGARNRNLAVIPAGAPTSHAGELLATRRFKEFIEQTRVVYDLVIIDSSPLLPVADTLEILPLVEGVVVCAREARTTREEASAVRELLSRLPKRPTGVVITGIRPNRSDYNVYEYSYSYG
jgi:Mrp family chromosome partitioning ATPase